MPGPPPEQTSTGNASQDWVQVHASLTRHPQPARASATAFFALLAPALAAWRLQGPVLFWFQRKPPDLRLRFLSSDGNALREQVRDVLERAVDADTIQGWHFAPYEPEWRKLGSLIAMDGYHRWADADTSSWMAFDRWLASSGPLAREHENQLAAAVTSAVLDALFVESIQDRHEIWDAWCNVLMMAGGPERPPARPSLEAPEPGRSSEMRDELRPQLEALAEASRQLSTRLHEAIESGGATTGLRATLALIAGFSLQRWGLDGAAQRALAESMSARWDPRPRLRGGFPTR